MPSQPLARPLILAGGAGERQRPRTEHLPKPLLPIDGRPLLWYVLDMLAGRALLPPAVVVSYKAELIKAFFADRDLVFHTLPGRTITGVARAVARADPTPAFIGMTADTLVAGAALNRLLRAYQRNGGKDTLLFTRPAQPLPSPWRFIGGRGRLEDIVIEDHLASHEIVFFMMNRDSLLRVDQYLDEHAADQELLRFEAGWQLILKAMLACAIEVRLEYADLLSYNINTPDCFRAGQRFVAELGRPSAPISDSALRSHL